MTDAWETAARETAATGPPGRPSPRLLAGAVAAALVLAAVGATGGWLLAGARNDSDSAAPTSSTPGSPVDTDTSSPGSPVDSPTRYVTPPVTRPRPARPGNGEFDLPDVTGIDFAEARHRLREHKLGVQVIFGGSGDDRTVERTQPAPGAAVRAGITVKLYVRGTAPPAPVPDVVGKSCADAGKVITEHGFNPQYVPGKAGRVMIQDPAPPAELSWNAVVKLYCGPGAGQPGTGTPSP